MIGTSGTLAPAEASARAKLKQADVVNTKPGQKPYIKKHR